MAFKVQFSRQASTVPVGVYEVITGTVGLDITTGGTEYIHIPMKIRSDVEQDCQGCSLQHRLWPKRNPTPEDEAVGGYSYKQIVLLSQAAGLPAGKEYASLEDWCADVSGRRIRVTYGEEEYQGKRHFRVQWIHATEHPAAPEAQSMMELEEIEDEMPF